MVKQYWKQKRTLTDGLTACCNPSTAKATKHHRYGVFISQSPANRKCARWVCPVLPTAPYNVAYQRCYHPSTNKTSCLVLLVDDLTVVRIKALATLNEIIAGRKVGWVLEADLKNFFGSLDHGWLLRFVEHRVGDPRIINLIRRWLKAGIMEDDEIIPNTEGTPQGGSISVLLSNLYLHYVLDLWFTKVVKTHLEGEAYLVRYINDFVICFQYRSDAMRVQNALRNRLAKFGIELARNKTKLVEFGRFAERHASKRGRNRPETLYFLGFTIYCTRNLKGKYRVGFCTEKSRLKRSLTNLCDLMKRMRHLSIKEQAFNLNRVLRGHYAYYGIAGNFRALQRVHRIVERYWRKMLDSRNREGRVTWEIFQKIKAQYPLQRPRLVLPYPMLQAIAVL